MQPSALISLPPTGSVSVPNGRHDEAPISKLHRDILWHIFMKNADMSITSSSHDLIHLSAAFSALTTARRSSQVCRHWRDVILSSSSVWSRCIDLHDLRQEHPHWRDEVLLRTGQSPLHVKGIIATSDETMFLLSLLDSNWERIRELEIDILDYSAVNDVRWSVFLRPAPTVRSVSIAFRWQTIVPDILSTQNIPIFADHAPALVWFTSSNILFRMPASSHPQLRHLDLKGRFTVAQLLGTLSQMLCIEYLSISGRRDQPIENTPMLKFPHTNFPRLSYISLYGSFGRCLTLLEHITPAPGCSLKLSTSSAGGLVNMQPRVSAVFHYAQSLFDSHIASKLDLKIRNNRFLLSCEEVVVPPSDSDSRRLPGFVFDIVGITRISILPLDSLLYSLSTCRLDKVTTLAIHPLLPDSESDFFNTNFTPFITMLHSLETLETTQGFFDILFKTDESRLVFPSLKKIIYKFYNTFPSDFMKSFLFRRQELGIPIQDLEISPSYSSFYQDMRPLDTLTGLRLKWKQGDILKEYTCGSGNPECLNLAKDLV
ncbi:hypothetical protein GALMADRAFT_244019 [Galerina marginata CBS 339.88]|uniref:F-box domain-containing protein n=1 Tax=Galerina marginata (strain CBS 339.88) TaxID=685588 RepID=A0A067TFA7_GALM3|nr:hypothetical protein GALMADRAFT_244019 [Galerina marginata CBS 339.88]